ncbi:MAG: hypothetical protein N2248_00475 [candidate division WOR-3 bacterium]|nr:hypothetical protein [candidate division WOR-3 bacterium]
MTSLLGSDLFFDNLRQLTIENGDLTLISDLDCLIANLYDRLQSARGALIAHPDFGADLASFIAENPSPDFLLDIAARARIELKKDPRIDDVLSCSAEIQSDNTILIIADLKTITGNILTNLIFPLYLHA